MDNQNENLKQIRHSAEHILTQAMYRLFPDIKMAMGPATDDGFYFDFDGDFKISPENFPKIEKEMKKIISQNLPLTKQEVSLEQARKLFKNNEYKQEWLDQIEELNEKPTLYWTGEPETDLSFEEILKKNKFVDLCAGPHVQTTKEIKAFKLLRTAGAYWRGDEKNKMLTRIYGTAFQSQTELDDYLTMLEEAQKRDHRKLGKELDLFCFSDLVGAGLPLFTPKGTIIIDELQKYIEDICRGYGFARVRTPHFAKIDLYETSGHAQKFSKELFRVSSSGGHDFVVGPVLCPHETQIYASRKRSYRDLPIRYMESDKMYRAEKTGEVGGLNRVYAITVEDGHVFCEVNQVKDEIKKLVKIIQDFYSSLGMLDKLWVSLSVRDYDHPEKYIGTDTDWDECEKILAEVSDELGLNAKKCEGEAALYGPKLDFMFKTVTGQEIQIPTVQIDFATPKRFNLLYTNKKGEEVNPVMVHRAVLGSYERFLVLLIEHYAGAFPLWLAPVQTKIIAVSEKHIKHCQKIADEFKSKNIRVEVDIADETVGNKIRKAVSEKIPYMLVIGDKEAESEQLMVRKRGSRDTEEFDKKDFFDHLKKIIQEKSQDL
jgi:threonyl-tRNA synthetase